MSKSAEQVLSDLIEAKHRLDRAMTAFVRSGDHPDTAPAPDQLLAAEAAWEKAWKAANEWDKANA